jgi:hypothetical protein
MNFKFFTLIGLPLNLMFLITNPQPSWAGCGSLSNPCPNRGSLGTYGPGRKELFALEQLITEGRATADNYFRAGELYAQFGEKAMAETRFNQARGVYNKLGDRQGVMKVDQKQQMLNSPLQRQTAPEIQRQTAPKIQMPGQNQIQQRQ